ncbi:MAG: glycosyltransferase [Elusimicrobia bacterium]|nr:glycosyltransferase [Elusimicrobiota bacterium]
MIIVVLPAFNEALNLTELIPDIDRALKSEYRILLVDDGSSDQTLEVVAEFASKYPVKLLRHASNRGLGVAIRTGITYALALYKPSDILITMDADNSHPPSQIPQMIKELERSDIVIASRYVADSSVSGLSRFRHLISKLGGGALGTFFPAKEVRDYTSGYRAIKLSVIKDYYDKWGVLPISSKGFPALGELLIRLLAEGNIVREIPLNLRYDKKKGPSKLRLIPALVAYFILIIKLLSERSIRLNLKKNLGKS